MILLAIVTLGQQVTESDISEWWEVGDRLSYGLLCSRTYNRLTLQSKTQVHDIYLIPFPASIV